MENITKALLIAAAVFLAMMILSLMVIGYNKISIYYKQQQELLSVEQMDKFNKQFQNYDRGDIRGNELISLMNKVIDYNTSQSYQVGTGYKPIKVTITIGSSYLDSFKYENRGNRNDLIKEKIENIVGDKASDANLIKITSTPDIIKDDAVLKGITNLDDTKLKKLTMEISYILIDNSLSQAQIDENKRIRASIIKNILGIEVADQTPEKIAFIEDAVSKYYQYTQFKRAHFQCTDMIHDTDTGRVVEMRFEVQTKNGHVQFD